MKKLLLFAVVLLSGCASEIAVFEQYNVQVPQNKATLGIEKTINWYRKNPFESANVQKMWQKYFAKSAPQTADFILTEKEQRDCSCPWDAITILSVAIIPTWGTAKCTYSYSLTQRETGKTVMLSDVQGKSRIFTGFLMMPALFFPDVSVMIPNDYYLTSAPAMASAIEEAASMVYNPNSPLYQQTPRRTPSAPIKQSSPAAQTEQASPAPAAAPSSPPAAPAKEPNPKEMDLLW